jgi:DNA-binding protein HU-beta
MTKTELVAKLAEVAAITKKQADQVLCAVVETVNASLLNNERIALPGLGSFTCITRKARIGRNPRTGKEIKIPEKKAVKFSAAAAIAKGLNTPPEKPKKAARAAAKKTPVKASKKK